MPVLIASSKRLLQRYPDLHLVIPVADTIKPAVIARYFEGQDLPHTLYQGKAVDVVSVCDCAVVASGTASLECALLAIPMCIIYKGSTLSYVLAFMLIKVRYFGLCNLLQDAMIAPELLQYDCNPTELTHMIEQLLQDTPSRTRMIQRLQQLKEALSAQHADISIASLIEQALYPTI
jgi:lipid-A-disaccharide synthase